MNRKIDYEAQCIMVMERKKAMEVLTLTEPRTGQDKYNMLDIFNRYYNVHVFVAYVYVCMVTVTHQLLSMKTNVQRNKMDSNLMIHARFSPANCLYFENSMNPIG